MASLPSGLWDHSEIFSLRAAKVFAPTDFSLEPPEWFVVVETHVLLGAQGQQISQMVFVKKNLQKKPLRNGQKYDKIFPNLEELR